MTIADLVIGDKYGFVDENNIFKLLCVHGISAWVLWCDDNEIETVKIDSDTLKSFIKLDSED